MGIGMPINHNSKYFMSKGLPYVWRGRARQWVAARDPRATFM